MGHYFVDGYFSKKLVTKFVVALHINRQLNFPVYRHCMVDMQSADIQSKLKDIDDYIRQEYLDQHPKKERDWRTYDAHMKSSSPGGYTRQ